MPRTPSTLLGASPSILQRRAESVDFSGGAQGLQCRSHHPVATDADTTSYPPWNPFLKAPQMILPFVSSSLTHLLSRACPPHGAHLRCLAHRSIPTLPTKEGLPLLPAPERHRPLRNSSWGDSSSPSTRVALEKLLAA